jgi:hypothetical protein
LLLVNNAANSDGIASSVSVTVGAGGGGGGEVVVVVVEVVSVLEAVEVF